MDKEGRNNLMRGRVTVVFAVTVQGEQIPCLMFARPNDAFEEMRQFIPGFDQRLRIELNDDPADSNVVGAQISLRRMEYDDTERLLLRLFLSVALEEDKYERLLFREIPLGERMTKYF